MQSNSLVLVSWYFVQIITYEKQRQVTQNKEIQDFAEDATCSNTKHAVVVNNVMSE